jgi:hypothetical protein
LTGLTDTEKTAMQKQATQQFLLGSLLSGDPATGFKSAMDIPATSLNMQKMIRDQQIAQRQQEELAGFMGKYAPTPTQAYQKAYSNLPENTSFDYNPTPEATFRQQQILGQPIDYNQALLDSLRLSGNPAQPQIRETLTAMQPKFQGNLRVDASGRVVGGVPSFDAKTGLVATPNIQGGNVNFDITPASGYGKAVERNLTYSLQPGETPLFDTAGNLAGVRTMSGSTQSLQERETAKAIAGTFGVSDQVVNPVTQQKEFRSRADILGYNKPPSTTGVTAGGARGAGGAVSELSPAQQAVNLATSKNYGKFTDIALDAALTVGDRKTSAEYLYNAAEQLDPNKLTEFFATGASYMRAIPGVGDKFDSFVGNVNLLNKTRSEGVLKGLGNIKGNANAFEGGIVDKATTGVTDPKFVTKYVSALEIAAADKDDARQRFIDAYTGDPKSIYTAWANSPENPRLYNHPKVNQFLNEQITAWQQGGSQGTPVMPSGFTFGTGKKSGTFLIKKPDGSVYRLGE